MMTMIKKNKWKLLISSILILLPIALGLILWNDLPELMTTHWGADGVADGYMSRGLAVFALPLFLLAMHWLCLWITSRDRKNREQNPKVFGITFWICPIISLFANGIMYAVSFGYTLHIGTVMFLLLGLFFAVIGNYLPKCKQNFTIGIKVKWALANEENWNATHRLGGKMWVIGGLVIMAGAFLPQELAIWALFPVFLVMILVPILYSCFYYKKQVKEGRAPAKAVVPMKHRKLILAIVLILIAVILAVCLFLMFSGNIDLQYHETSFTISASYYDDLTVDYDAIDRIEYRESGDAGSRTFGFDSARLSMGKFENDEFGTYTRYTYTKCKAHILLEIDGKILVINGKDAACTKAIYNELLERIDPQ